MNDATILYSGMLCFGLILLALVLTIREFRRTPSRVLPPPDERPQRGRIEAALDGRARP